MSGYVLVDKNVEHQISPGDNPKIYRGLGRNPWPGLAEDYYNHTLSPELLPIAKRIFESSDDFNTCKNRSDVDTIARSKYGVGCEILFVTDSEEFKSFENLGFDVCLSHEWNLILGGIAVQHKHFQNLEDIFNGNGLISKYEDAKLYIQRYREVMSESPDEGPELFDDRLTPYILRILRV